jgi:hypothetical protein
MELLPPSSQGQSCWCLMVLYSVPCFLHSNWIWPKTL